MGLILTDYIELAMAQAEYDKLEALVSILTTIPKSDGPIAAALPEVYYGF